MEAKNYPWSASRIGCFAECSLKYKLNDVEGWKSDAPVNTQLADKGSAFHKAAESYHTGMSEEDFRKNLAKYAEAYHVNTTDPEKEFYYNYEPAIKKFFAFWKHFVEPREQHGYKVGQEQKVDNVINGEAFTGSLDLCIENDMEILIFDYKTGRSINVNNYKDQQLLYAYMKGLERGWDIPEIAKKVRCFIFGPLIEDLQTKTVEQNMLRGVKEIEYTEEDLRHIIEDYYMKNIDDIHSMNWARARGKTQDFHACQWCPYLGSKENPETGFCGCKVTADLGFSTPEGVSFHSKKLGK